MRIIVVATEQSQLDLLTKKAAAAVRGAEIAAFVDPMLAIQQLVNDPAGLIIAQADLKYISVQDFIKLARKLGPKVYIILVSDKTEYRAASGASGADRFLSPAELPEALPEIIRQQE